MTSLFKIFSYKTYRTDFAYYILCVYTLAQRSVSYPFHFPLVIILFDKTTYSFHIFSCFSFFTKIHLVVCVFSFASSILCYSKLCFLLRWECWHLPYRRVALRVRRRDLHGTRPVLHGNHHGRRERSLRGILRGNHRGTLGL